MSVNLSVNRKLIREYFECLSKGQTTVTEAFGKQVISDLLAHWKDGGEPKQGIFAYIIIGVLLFSLLISPFITFLLVVVTFVLFLAKIEKSRSIILPVDDRQIDQWLLEDKRKLFDKAPNELDVIVVGESEDTPELLNVVMNQKHPIELSSGFTLTDEEKKSWGILIRDRDYFVEKGLDGKTRYSIHVFLNIFLCRNFLTYYKCYWNFLRGEEILVETGEYLYDTIVSINTHESSLSSLANGEGKKLIMK